MCKEECEVVYIGFMWMLKFNALATFKVIISGYEVSSCCCYFNVESFVFFFAFYIFAKSLLISGFMRLRTHSNFIVLPHWVIRPLTLYITQ